MFRAMSALTVGGEVDSYCTTCKINRLHLIIAMVGEKPAKVECLSCHGHHRYRANPPGTPKVAAKRTRKPTGPESKKHITLTESSQMSTRLRELAHSARKYSPNDHYSIDDVVTHPTFGQGLVVELPATQKAAVFFQEGGVKLLVHDRGTPTAAPNLERPSPIDHTKAGPSDTPRRV
jgi:hypothetical protein